MSTIAKLLVELGLDAKGFHGGISEAATRSKGLGGVLSTALGTAAGFLTGGAFAAGIGKLNNFLADTTAKATEAQQADAQLNAVLASTKGLAGVTASAASDLANSLSKVTRNADDEIQVGENMLLTFTNIGKDTFPTATKAMLDMATAMSGGARPSAQQLSLTAIQLGKALNDPIKGVTALQRVGVRLTEQQKEQVKAFVKAGDIAKAQGVILKELSTEFGGSAEAAGKTTAGQADIMANSFGRMQEKVGGVILDIRDKLFATFGPTIISLLQGFADLIGSPAITSGVGMIGDALKAIGGIISGLGAGGDPFGVITNGLYNMLAALGMGRGEAATWAAGIAAFVANAIAGFQQLVGWVQANWPPFRDLIVGVFNAVVAWVQANWPQIQTWIIGAFQQARSVIEPIINAISTIVRTVFTALAQFLAEHGAEIQGFIASAWQSIQQIITGVVEIIQLTIVPIWNAIAKFISDNQDTIKAVIELVWNSIKLIISTVLDVIKGIINVFIKILKGDWQGAWDAIKETAVNVWNDIKAFFDGIPSQLLTVGRNIIEGIVKGLLAAREQVITALAKIIMDAIASIKKTLGISSPSKIFKAMGMDMMLGLANGISGFGALPQVQLQGVVAGLAPSALSMRPAYNGGGASTSASVAPNGGSITIQNIMDGQVISEQVYRRLGDQYYADQSGQWGQR